MLRWHDFAVLARYEIPKVFLQSQYQQELLLFWPQLQIIPLRLSLSLKIFGEAVWSCCRLQANLRSKATCFRVSTKSEEKLNLQWVKIFLKGTFFLHAPVTTLIFHKLWVSHRKNIVKRKRGFIRKDFSLLSEDLVKNISFTFHSPV